MYVTLGALKRLSQLMAGQATTSVAITGGTISGVTLSGSTITGITGTTTGSGLTFGWETVAAAGTTSANAAALSAASGVMSLVTGANAAAGVILPACTTAAGSFVKAVYNNATGTNTLIIYPAGAEKINQAASITITTGVMAIIVGAATGSWAATYRATT